MFKVGDIIKYLQEYKMAYGYVHSESKRNKKVNSLHLIKEFDAKRLYLILDIQQIGNHKEITFFVDNRILYANSLMFEYV